MDHALPRRAAVPGYPLPRCPPRAARGLARPARNGRARARGHARRVYQHRKRDPARRQCGRCRGRCLDVLPPGPGHAARARGVRRGDVDPGERVLVRVLHPDRRGTELPDRRRPRVRGGLPLPDRRVPGRAGAQPPPRVGSPPDRPPPDRGRPLAGRPARGGLEVPDHPRRLRARRSPSVGGAPPLGPPPPGAPRGHRRVRRSRTSSTPSTPPSRTPRGSRTPAGALAAIAFSLFAIAYLTYTKEVAP